MKHQQSTWQCALVFSCLFASEKAMAQVADPVRQGLGAKRDSIIIAKDSVAINKPDQNRNVMLNAANNNGPREVNVGLPSSVGGTTILENDLPVVYFYWPELPTKAWRASVSLGKTGLLGLKEVANTTGNFGFAVNSYTKLGGDKTEISINLATSNFGWIKVDANVSGPLAKQQGLYYSAGVFQNYDPQSYDLGFGRYSDKTQIYRAGLTKRSSKGEISLLYKYARSLTITNYALFRYQEGGEAQELDNFRIGRDSYVLNTGKVRMLDANTGEYYTMDMNSMGDTGNQSHTLDLLGNYKLANNWRFKFVMRYHDSRNSTTATSPTSIFTASPSNGFYYQDGGTPYTGPVQIMFTTNARHAPASSFTSRFELLKKRNAHNWRIGLTEYAYRVDNFTYNRTYYYQSVEAQPRLLSNYGTTGTGRTVTDQYGYYGYNQGLQYFDGRENQLAVFFSDAWQVSPKLDLTYGTNVRYHKMDGQYYAGARTTGLTLLEKQFTPFHNKWLNLAANVNAVYKITPRYGVIGNLIYTENGNSLNNYSNAVAPGTEESRSKFGSIGLYWNHPKFNVVSSLTYLSKNNYRNNFNLVNPSNAAEVTPVVLNYGIQTIGWTTDIVAKPAKGLLLHYLLTVQDPTYQDYQFTAFGTAYDYDGKNVLQILQGADGDRPELHLPEVPGVVEHPLFQRPVRQPDQRLVLQGLVGNVWQRQLQAFQDH